MPIDRSVLNRPPIFSCDSNTTTVNPAVFNFFAAARPAIPAPMTIIFLSVSTGVSSVSNKEQALVKEDWNKKNGLALMADSTNLRRNIGKCLFNGLKIAIFI
jgi:hypothetical protein